MPRSVWVLMAIAALVMSSAPLVLLVGGFVGHQLSPSEVFKTLPIACFVVGGASCTYPGVRLMGLWGRKRVFVLAGVGMVIGAAGAAASVASASFIGFCSAVFVLGGAQAIFQQLRFAAMELVAHELAPSAVSRLMLSGLIAAVLGPELVSLGAGLHSEPFVGGFLLLILIAFAALVLVLFGYWPGQAVAETSSDNTALPVSPTFLRNPIFWFALIAAAVAYALMSLVMTATPLTMHIHHHFDLLRTKEVIQAHIIAMFLPSFFTGNLIRRFGADKIILLGMACYLAMITVALSGVALLHFWGALILLGVGWNFMFIGATSLLPLVYPGQDPIRVQALNDAVVVVCQACAALTAGWLLDLWGWQVLLLSCLLLLAVCAGVMLWVKINNNNAQGLSDRSHS